MKFLIYIQVLINRSKDILITICIWIKGIHEKKPKISQKWAIRLCIHPPMLGHLFWTYLIWSREKPRDFKCKNMSLFFIGISISGRFCYYKAVWIFCQPLHEGRKFTLNMFFHSYNSIRFMLCNHPFLHLVCMARISWPIESLW